MISRKFVDNQRKSMRKRMNDKGKLGILVAVILFLGLLGTSKKSEAQAIEVGVNAGLSSYFGDINPANPFNKPSLGLGGMVRYYQGARWAYRFSYQNRKVTAEDTRPDRGLEFVTDINDFALITEFNFLNYVTGSKRNTISPYLFLGASFVKFNPKDTDGTELCNILTDVVYDSNGNETKKDGDAKYKKYTGAIPFGFGVKYGIGKRLCLSAEWRVDWTWTDYIDDCHGYYPMWEDGDPWAQYADPTGNMKDNDKKYLSRGNSVKYDFLSYLSLSVAFKFNLPASKKCDAGMGKNAYIYY